MTTEDQVRKQFMALKPRYFQEVNLSAYPDQLNTMLAFAETLHQLADYQSKIVVEQSALSQADKELAGLVYIYDALFTIDACDAVQQGKIKLQALEKFQRFANSDASDQEELQARAQY